MTHVISKKSWKFFSAVQLLQVLSQVLGLSVPNLYGYKGLSFFYIIYVVLLALISTIASLVNIILNKKTSGNYAADITVSSILLIATVVSIGSAIFLKRRKIIHLVKVMDKLERQLQLKGHREIQIEANLLLIQFVLFQSFILSINIYNFYIEIIASNCGISQIVSGSLYHIQVITISEVILQIHFYCNFIRGKLKSLHQQMYKAIRLSSQDEVIMGNETIYFLRQYDDISEAIELVNDIYSLQRFLILAFIFASSSVDLCSEFERQTFVFQMTTILSVLENFTLAVILAMTCGNTVCEVKKTSSICFEILMRVPGYPENPHVKTIKTELLSLVENIKERNVQFSSRLFTVDEIVLVLFEAILTFWIIKYK